MNESTHTSHYAEYAVEKKYEGKFGAMRRLAIALYILFPIVVLLILLAVNVMIAAVTVLVLIPLAPTFLAFVIRKIHGHFFKIEYEYQVASGELVISEIRNKRSRKDLITITMANVETVAPYRDSYKDECDKGSYDRIIDAVSSMNSPDLYFAVVPDEEDKSKKTLVYFEATAKMLRLLSLYNRKTVVEKVRF
ncbi:MAG: hypothetical protein IJD10_02120 [Clostridia bacterium]|nr:hypothetical protein [Clostridia bacterium]